MKFFRYIIYALIAVIIVCLIVLIIQPEKSQALRPKEKEENVWVNAPKSSEQPIVNSEQEPRLPSNYKKITLTDEELATMPAFIQALPRDPAEVDSNGNDIRDDVEVQIGYLLPFDPNRRAVHYQMAAIIDKMIKERGKGRDSLQFSIIQEERNAISCWKRYGFTEKELADFKALLLNTKQRIEHYHATIDARKVLDQEVIDSLKQPDDPCDTMLIENQNSLQSWIPKD